MHIDIINYSIRDADLYQGNEVGYSIILSFRKISFMYNNVFSTFFQQRQFIALLLIHAMIAFQILLIVFGVAHFVQVAAVATKPRCNLSFKPSIIHSISSDLLIKGSILFLLLLYS